MLGLSAEDRIPPVAMVTCSHSSTLAIYKAFLSEWAC